MNLKNPLLNTAKISFSYLIRSAEYSLIIVLELADYKLNDLFLEFEKKLHEYM